MPKLTENRLPKYRKHKPTAQAVVTLSGRDFYLGNHGTARSKAEYDRLVSEWVANGRRLSAAGSDITVSKLLAAYLSIDCPPRARPSVLQVVCSFVESLSALRRNAMNR